MIVKRNIKDVRNITVQGGDMRMRFDRISPTEFKVSHYSIDPTQDICPKCSAFIIPGEEDEHRHEKYQIIIESEVIDQIHSLFREYVEDQPNIVAINEGYDDEGFFTINPNSEFVTTRM